MRRVLLAAIGFYQRYVSPYKGFCCAYRQHTGRASCSAVGARAVRRHGTLVGLRLIRRRTQLCGVAHRRFRGVPPPPLHAQQGVCDIGCDLPCDAGCDLPSGGGNKNVCNLLICCDCGSCDWPKRRVDRKSKRSMSTYRPRSGAELSLGANAKETRPNPSLERTSTGLALGPRGAQA